MSRRLALLAMFFASLLGAAIGILVFHQFESGAWRIPKGALIRLERRLSSTKPPQVVFLERRAITLYAGADDSSTRRSSIVERSGLESVRTPGFSGSERQWKRIVRCVRATFAPFDLTITDRPPAPGDDHVLVAVGGTAEKILGRTGPHVGGLAPFNGDAIPSPVVFVFSQRLRNQLRPVCNTIAMEVAHAYGLDHAYDCKDVMTYLPDCGPKYFLDKDIPCGEHRPRSCEGGGRTQNSYRHFARMVGLRASQRAGPAN